ncbi:MAG: hypothetical protein PVI23_12530, partial [Maricaulaceae bacterium]
ENWATGETRPVLAGAGVASGAAGGLGLRGDGEPAATLAPGGGLVDPGWRYGRHVWVPADGSSNSSGEFALFGEYGQYVWVDQRRGVVIAMAAADRGWSAHRAEAVAVLRAAAAYVDAD